MNTTTKNTIKIYKKKGGNFAVVRNGYSRNRTCDTSVNSRSLYQLSYTPVGCLLLTPFTLSALGYADYTKYRLLNLYLFVLQICGYLPLVPLQCKSGVHSQNRPQLCSLYTHITKRSTWNRTKDAAIPRTSTTDAILRIKTPPDEKGQKSGGVPNVVWKAFGVFLLTPCYTIYYLKRTMWTKRTNFYFSFIHL